MTFRFGSNEVTHNPSGFGAEKKTFGSALRLLAIGGALAAFAATGCSSTPTKSAQGTPSTVEDAVAVNVYKGGALSATCSGTLLSSHVVMTSAHCAAGADGIRVR